MLLAQLVNEVSRNEVSDKFAVDSGTIEKLQKDASVHVGQATLFCAKMSKFGYSVYSGMMKSMQGQLDFGVQDVLLDLCQISSIRPSVARLLYDAGVESIAQLARTAVEDVEELLESKVGINKAARRSC